MSQVVIDGQRKIISRQEYLRLCLEAEQQKTSVEEIAAAPPEPRKKKQAAKRSRRVATK